MREREKPGEEARPIPPAQPSLPMNTPDPNSRALAILGIIISAATLVVEVLAWLLP